MIKPTDIEVVRLELRLLFMYEAFYDNLQPYFAEKNIQCPYIDTDAFVLGPNTNNTIKGLKMSVICLILAIRKKIMNSSVIRTKRWLVNSK